MWSRHVLFEEGMTLYHRYTVFQSNQFSFKAISGILYCQTNCAIRMLLQGTGNVLRCDDHVINFNNPTASWKITSNCPLNKASSHLASSILNPYSTISTLWKLAAWQRLVMTNTTNVWHSSSLDVMSVQIICHKWAQHGSVYYWLPRINILRIF